MSSKKYITIDSRELADLRRDSSQLRALRQDLPEKLENDIRQIQRGMDNRLAPIESRQREFSRAVQNLDTNIRQVEQSLANRIASQAQQTRQALNETSIKLDRQKHELRKELYETAQKLTDKNLETENKLNKKIQATETRLLQINKELHQEMVEQEQRLNNAINCEKKNREEALRKVNLRVDEINQQYERIAEEANKSLTAAQTIRDFIESHYQHEHFAPNELSNLEKIINSAQTSIQLGAPEAALAEANSAYQGLSNLRLDLERREAEWRFWREQALLSASRLIAEAQVNRKVSGVEQENEVAEVNFWTGNKLAELENELNQIKQQTVNEKPIINLDDMRKLVEKTLPEMNCRLDNIIEEAQIAVISSQLRTNIADLAVQALERMGGYKIKDATYEGEDMRGGFYTEVENITGSKIVISVTPEGEKNRLTINSYDETRTPAELLQRSQDIAQAMAVQGLEVSQPVKESDIPSVENRDLEQVRKRKIRTISKKQEPAQQKIS